MLVKKSMVAVFAIACLLLVTSSALACACCSERGTYDVWTGRVDTYHLGLFKEIKFGKSAEMFMTEAAFETIRDLDALEREADAGTLADIGLVDAFTNNTWKLNFKTVGGKTGTLTLTVPAKMIIFRVDTHEKVEEGREITVYKEFQFKGTVGSGTGIFRGSIVRPTMFSLVFQGRGNNCDNAEDFTDWRLEVNGAKAKYAFFGKLNS